LQISAREEDPHMTEPVGEVATVALKFLFL
jgi:hypothetical protein